MFMLTIQRQGLKQLGAVVLCGAVLVAAAAAGRMVRRRAGDAMQAAAPVPAVIATTQDIQNYFLGFGLEVDPTDITADKVKVPRRWDDSFAAFNNIVSQSGKDLTGCKGKTVEKWLAAIPALGSGGQSVYGVLLVRGQQAVGAYLVEKPSGSVSGLSDVVAARAAQESPAPAAADLPADPAGELDADAPILLAPDAAQQTGGFPVD